MIALLGLAWGQGAPEATLLRQVRPVWPEAVEREADVTCHATLTLDESAEVQWVVIDGCPEAFENYAISAARQSRWSILPPLPVGATLEAKLDVVFDVTSMAPRPHPTVPVPAPMPQPTKHCTVVVTSDGVGSRGPCPFEPAEVPEWPLLTAMCRVDVVLGTFGSIASVDFSDTCSGEVVPIAEKWIRAARVTTEADGADVRVFLVPQTGRSTERAGPSGNGVRNPEDSARRLQQPEWPEDASTEVGGVCTVYVQTDDDGRVVHAVAATTPDCTEAFARSAELALRGSRFYGARFIVRKVVFKPHEDGR